MIPYINHVSVVDINPYPQLTSINIKININTNFILRYIRPSHRSVYFGDIVDNTYCVVGR